MPSLLVTLDSTVLNYLEVHQFYSRIYYTIGQISSWPYKYISPHFLENQIY